jgi:hypothetical protein
MTSPLPSAAPSLTDILAALATVPAHDPARYQTTDGLDTPRCTNAHRAEFAARALCAFQQACAMDEAIDTATSDLICDLLHLLHANNHDPLPTLQTALHSFLCEAGPLE